MEPLATVEDVEANYRSLRGQEIVNTDSWLRTASAQLRIQVSGLDARIALDSSFADLVRGVVTMAVIRVLRGADRADPAQGDAIYFTRAELDSLTSSPTGSGSAAFSIVPLASPGRIVPAEWPWW